MEELGGFIITKLRPYLKYFIAGGNVCGVGATLLILGAMFSMFTHFMGSNAFTILSVVFIVIGVVVLIIGIALLFKGMNDRKFWLQAHRNDLVDSEPEMSREQPMRRAEVPASDAARFCPICGKSLPNLRNIKFCPTCGEPLV